MYAVALPPDNVPAAVVVPNESKFVNVVFTIPDVSVNVELIDIGVPIVTPEALLLFIVKLVSLAVGEEAKFRKVPAPLIVCATVLTLLDVPDGKARVSSALAVWKLPELTVIFPPTIRLTEFWSSSPLLVISKFPLMPFE